MAKIEDYQPMDEGDILKALELNIKSAVGYYDSELSKSVRRSPSITTLSYPSQLMTVTRSSYHRMSTLAYNQ